MNELQKFQANWKCKHFSKKQKPVLLACSGGRDSMVLAQILLQLRIDFGIAHCNFQLRGNESDDDELFVKDYALQNNLPFFSTSFNTKQVAADNKKGIQETARELRYQWLEEIRRKHNFGFIATAHHANDNVETLLINLFKGTGLSGLHGIREVNGNIIRPLLFATRENINEFISTNHISFREDSSNSSEKYLRNDLRLNIIPKIEKTFPNAILQVSESIFRFAQAEMLYKKTIEKQIKKLVQQRGDDVYIPVLKLLKSDVKETLVYEIFSGYEFNAAQVAPIVLLASAESGKFIENEQYKIIKDRDFLILTQKKETSSQFYIVEQFPSSFQTIEGKFSICLSEENNIVDDSNIALIDFKELEIPLIIRRWRSGDYSYPLGMGMKKKKLSRFFINQKIPLNEKEKMWVFESNKRIVWVAGLRLDERFKIKPSTTKVLRVVFKPH
jgi:tRNA(Ile)-lysidine synthase